MNNPKIVTDSIIDSNGTNTSTSSIRVYPISIFRYAWLERLESPFIDPTKKFDVGSIIPTAFVFCSVPDQLRKYTSKDVELLKNDAYAWADLNLKLDDIPELIKNITSQMTDLNKAAPDAVSSSTDESQDGPKKNNKHKVPRPSVFKWDAIGGDTLCRRELPLVT